MPGTRRQNEAKFGSWQDLPNKGRLYQLRVQGKAGWSARYMKEVDPDEKTVRFWRKYMMTGASCLKCMKNIHWIADTEGCSF